jgi:hypothetical protein
VHAARGGGVARRSEAFGDAAVMTRNAPEVAVRGPVMRRHLLIIAAGEKLMYET